MSTNRATSITKQLLVALRPELDAAIAAVGAKHGLSLKIGNGSYEPDGASAKFQLLIGLLQEGDDPSMSVERIKARAEYTRHAAIYGLEPEWLGRTFTRATGEKATIVGLMPNRTKFPVLCTVEGKPRGILLTTNEVKREFGKDPHAHVSALMED